jgi:nicotinate-nucleotide adenylyltransferase
MSKVVSEEKLYNIESAKIGLLGGTFDPPHYAHIHMAQTAKDALELDFVVFMPLGVPPHGKDGISKAYHRVAMLELMLADNDDFFIDEYEARSNEPSYTMRSMERINSLLGNGTKLYFIIGADSLMYLEKWYAADRLFQITEFAVIPRPGYDDNECIAHIKKLSHEFGARIKYLDARKMNYSSTDIRNTIEKGENETSPEIIKYIKENNLYG